MQILRLYNGKYLSDVFFSLFNSDQMTLFLFDSFSWASRLLSSFYVCLAPLRNTHLHVRNMHLKKGKKCPCPNEWEREEMKYTSGWPNYWFAFFLGRNILYIPLIVNYLNIQSFYLLRKWPLESLCMYSVAPSSWLEKVPNNSARRIHSPLVGCYWAK